MASRKLLESMSREVCVCVSVSVSLSLCLSLCVSLPMAFCCLLCWWPVFPMLCVSTQCCCCCCLLFVLAKALLRRCTELEQLLAKHGVPVPAAAMAGFRTTRKTKPQRQFDFSKYSKRKIALKVAYLGEKYHGLAIQESSPDTIEVRYVLVVWLQLILFLFKLFKLLFKLFKLLLLLLLFFFFFFFFFFLHLPLLLPSFFSTALLNFH